MTTQENSYKTLDIFEGAWIYSQKVRLLGLEPSGRYSYFVFENQPLCKSLSSDYWSQKASGNIKQFVSSLKTLKDLVFSQKEGWRHD